MEQVWNERILRYPGGSFNKQNSILSLSINMLPYCCETPSFRAIRHIKFLHVVFFICSGEYLGGILFVERIKVLAGKVIIVSL